MKRTHDRTHRASTVNTAYKSLVHCTSIPKIPSPKSRWLFFPQRPKPAWQAFEREGKGSFRCERSARGARGGREGNACQETIVFAIPPTNYVCKNNATVND